MFFVSIVLFVFSIIDQDTGLLIYVDVADKNLRDLVILDPKVCACARV